MRLPRVAKQKQPCRPSGRVVRHLLLAVRAACLFLGAGRSLGTGTTQRQRSGRLLEGPRHLLLRGLLHIAIAPALATRLLLGTQRRLDLEALVGERSDKLLERNGVQADGLYHVPDPSAVRQLTVLLTCRRRRLGGGRIEWVQAGCDLVDLKSRVAQLKKSGRNYTLLDELNLRPALSYLAKVRNSEDEV